MNAKLVRVNPADMLARRGHLTVGGDGRFTGGPQDGLQAQLTTLIHRS